MIYFDHAGMGIPREDALKQEFEYKLAMSRDPSLEFKYFDRIERNKKYIGRNIFGATNYMVSYVRNATEGLTIASNVLPIAKDDEIIITNLEHRAAANSWEYICRLKKAKLVIVDIAFEDSEETIFAKYEAVLTEKTKVIFCSHIDRNFGLLFPVKQLSELAKRNHAFMVIDGAQSAGLIDFNLDEIDCDIYVCSFHKWCRMPAALGVMLTNNRITHTLNRLYVGERRLAEEKPEEKDFGTDELGTRNVALEMCLPMLVDWLTEYRSASSKVVDHHMSRIGALSDKIRLLHTLTINGRGFSAVEILTDHNPAIQDVFYSDYGILLGRINYHDKCFLRISYDHDTTESDFHILFEALKDYARNS